MTLDEPVIFYLEHRAYIDQWCELRKNAATASHRFFSSLKPDLEALARSMPAAPRVHSVLNDGWPRILMACATWFASDKEAPFVGIGVEWVRKQVAFEGGAAYYGIRLDRTQQEAIAVEQHVRQAIAGVPSDGDWRPTKWYPLMLYIAPPRDRYWEDLESFGNMVVSACGDVWRKYHAVLDEVIRERS